MYVRERLVVSVDDFHAQKAVGSDLGKFDAQRLSDFVAKPVTINNARAPVRPFLAIAAGADSDGAIKLRTVGLHCHARNRLIQRGQRCLPYAFGGIGGPLRNERRRNIRGQLLDYFLVQYADPVDRELSGRFGDANANITRTQSLKRNRLRAFDGAGAESRDWGSRFNDPPGLGVVA